MARNSRVKALAGTVICEEQPTALVQRMAVWIADVIGSKTGAFRLALSGGETPKALYSALASDPFRTRIEWQRLEVFWGDERFVAHDDPRSNFAMARQALLSHVPILPENIHPMPVTGTAEYAAERYDALLRNIYGATTFDAKRPLFDLILLGLGSDGHTASLIPNQPVLNENEKWTAAVEAGRDEPRLTLTYPVLNNSAAIAFLVTGLEKADAVKRTRLGDPTIPAGRLNPQGKVKWFLDSSAAQSSTALPSD